MTRATPAPHRSLRRRAGGALALAAVPSALLLASTGIAPAWAQVGEPGTFTSAFRVTLTPEQVVDMTGAPTGGVAGATGTFDLRLNSDLQVLCYDVSLTGVEPPYASPAATSTHLHEGASGASGPPRLVFADPTGSGPTRTSSGCVSVPQDTGLTPTGTAMSTGAGFSLAEVEADPSAFYADAHNEAAAPGAVRGQLTAQALPVGGVDTGGGGLADDGTSPALPLAAAGGALAAAVVGLRLAHRRRA